MPFSARSTASLCSLTLCCAACIAAAQAVAATLSVDVRDRSGDAVPGVAVYAVPTNGAAGNRENRVQPTAVMDQYNRAFVPHILVVETGTKVDFPNHDNVSHHVYSFSPAKQFELALYKGDVHPPLTFDRAGVVVLGCNIHDDMLGYILVVDTPHFSKTDASGHAELGSLTPGAYSVHVWTPRARDKELPPAVSIVVPQESAGHVDFRFEGKLFAPHRDDATSLSWSQY